MTANSSEQAPDRLLAVRDRFPILATTNYLISNSLGAVPSASARCLQEYYETWAMRGVRAWEETWWMLVEDLGNLVAPLIGASPGEVVFQPNVTLAHAVVLSGLDFRGRRPRIITDAMHFPSILYLLDGLRHEGAEVRVVPSEDGVSVDAGRLVAEIDERTAAVCVSHVLFKSSYVQDIAAIAEQARRAGALSIIDGYQSVGAMPVDVKRLGIDVYIGGCLKWLCGGPGAAFLWSAPDARPRLRPRLTGWMAHERPFAFEPTMSLRGDSWRFLHGTPNIAALYAARPGLEIITRLGVKAIREKSLRQTARLLELAGRHGYSCTTPRDAHRRGGTVAIDIPHGHEISRCLKALDILCDYRPGAGIRLSPHFYTRDDELDAAIKAIHEIETTWAWKAFTAGRSPVT